MAKQPKPTQPADDKVNISFRGTEDYRDWLARMALDRKIKVQELLERSVEAYVSGGISGNRTNKGKLAVLPRNVLNLTSVSRAAEQVIEAARALENVLPVLEKATEGGTTNVSESKEYRQIMRDADAKGKHLTGSVNANAQGLQRGTKKPGSRKRSNDRGTPGGEA